MKNRKMRKNQSIRSMNDMTGNETKAVKRDECGSCPSKDTEL